MMPLFVIVSFIPQRPQKPQKQSTANSPTSLKFVIVVVRRRKCFVEQVSLVKLWRKKSLLWEYLTLRKAFSIYHCINQKPQQNMDNWISRSQYLLGLRNCMACGVMWRLTWSSCSNFVQLCLWNVNSHAYKVWTLLLKLWFLFHF